MTEHPSLQLLQRKKKPASNLEEKMVRSQLKEYAGKLAVLKQSLDEAAVSYRQFITNVYRQASEAAENKRHRDIVELKVMMEQANAEVTGLLNQIVGFLEQTRQNVELERESLGKLNAYLDKVQ